MSLAVVVLSFVFRGDFLDLSGPNCSVMDHDGVPSENDDAIHAFFGELEMLYIAIPETKVGWKFRREDEFVGFVEALSFQ